MVSHRILSDSKSPQVSRTLLGILADLTYAVAWIVSTPSLISKFSSFCPNPLVIVQRASITIFMTLTHMFHSFSESLQVLRNYSSFNLLSILLCGPPEQESSRFNKFLFSFGYHYVWSSGWDKVIRLYLKILEEFVSHSPGEILGCT